MASFKKAKLPVPVENKYLRKNKVGTIYIWAMFLAQVEGGDKDLHSGTFGGIIHEPLMDLVALLGNNVHHCSGVAGEWLAISLMKISAIFNWFELSQV